MPHREPPTHRSARDVRQRWPWQSSPVCPAQENIRVDARRGVRHRSYRARRENAARVRPRVPISASAVLRLSSWVAGPTTWSLVGSTLAIDPGHSARNGGRRRSVFSGVHRGGCRTQPSRECRQWRPCARSNLIGCRSASSPGPTGLTQYVVRLIDWPTSQPSVEERRDGATSLHVEQGALAVQSAAVAGEAAIRPDHAMARHDDPDRVVAVGKTDGT